MNKLGFVWNKINNRRQSTQQTAATEDNEEDPDEIPPDTRKVFELFAHNTGLSRRRGSTFSTPSQKKISEIIRDSSQSFSNDYSIRQENFTVNRPNSPKYNQTLSTLLPTGTPQVKPNEIRDSETFTPTFHEGLEKLELPVINADNHPTVVSSLEIAFFFQIFMNTSSRRHYEKL